MNYNMKKITLTVAPNVPVLEFIGLVLSALHPKFGATEKIYLKTMKGTINIFLS